MGRNYKKVTGGYNPGEWAYRRKQKSGCIVTLYIIIGLLSFTFFSCSKDDDDNFINNGTGVPNNKEYIKSIEIAEGPIINVIDKQTDTLRIIHKPGYLDKPTCFWTSSDWTVVSIDRYSGVFRAMSVGECTITATTKITIGTKVEELTAECVINVQSIEVENIEFDIHEKEIELFEEFVLTPTITPNDASDKSIVWSSSDSTIATVNKKGLVKGNKIGVCHIYATTQNNKVAECKVIVKPASVKSIELEATEIKIGVGGEKKINFTITPTYAEIRNLKWEIDNETIASISDSGIVTCKSIGKTKARVIVNEKLSAECSIIGCDIDEFVEIIFKGLSGVNINGNITGEIYFSLANNSSKRIIAEKVEILHGNTRNVKYSDNLNETIIEPKSQISYNARVDNIYKPIFKLTFTYNDKTYTIENQFH